MNSTLIDFLRFENKRRIHYMKKVISFSLWGSAPLYWKGAAENILLARQLYPDWTCRFYIDSKCDSSLIKSVEFLQCEIILMTPKNTLSGLIWRFLAADDCDVMISRDADSRLTQREALAVEKWLASDKDFHIMRDHPMHKTLILGGMWGCRNMSGFSELIDAIPIEHQDLKGFDQFFLAKEVYPQVIHSSLVHDSYCHFNDGVDFPSVRSGSEFVGAVIPVDVSSDT